MLSISTIPSNNKNRCRECFIPWYHIGSADDVQKFVGESFPDSAIICRLNKDQVKSYMQDLWEKYV